MRREHRFIVDYTRCIRCGECVSDCPINILAIGTGPPFVVDGRELDCIGCQHCMAVCPTGAVSVLGLAEENSEVIADAFPVPARLATLIKGRRSVRRYREEDVARTVIERLIETAGHAPSGGNCRQVRFSVVAEHSVMSLVRRQFMDCADRALVEECFAASHGFLRRIVDGWRQFEADALFRWAPHLIVTSAPDSDASPVQDSILALSYFELLAQDMGLGTLWNGTATYLLDIFPQLRATLMIPEHHVIGSAMCFGVPAVIYQRTVQYPDPSICWVTSPS